MGNPCKSKGGPSRVSVAYKEIRGQRGRILIIKFFLDFKYQMLDNVSVVLLSDFK